MTEKERCNIDYEFYGLLIDVIRAHLAINHFDTLEFQFDTNGKIKERYEVKITKKEAENGKDSEV